MSDVMRVGGAGNVLRVVLIGLAWGAALPGALAEGQPAYRSPYLLALSPDGGRLYALDRTAARIAVIDTAARQVVQEIPLEADPCGLALSPDGGVLYAAERWAGTVAVIDTARAAVTERIRVDQWPGPLAVAPQAGRLYVGGVARHRIRAIDLGPAIAARAAEPPPAWEHADSRVMLEVPVVREPSCLGLTPDERFLVATNLLPDGAGTDPQLAAVVSLIDLATLEHTAVHLPPGSTTVQGLWVSPDGMWAYVVHTLARFHMPITQLERGWVNTYALTIIEIPAARRAATLLLDDLTQGAAGPFSVIGARDGSRLWISHAGTHEVSRVEIGRVHELLAGRIPEEVAAMRDGNRPNVWVRMQKDAAAANDLENDLTALSLAGAIQRMPSGGNGPRGLALSPDGQVLYVANYYEGNIGVLSAADGQWLGAIRLGESPPPDDVRRGEVLFHDATLALQRWHSCATCHPNQGRVDGLRWDFLRDGIGNGKDTISLLLVDETPPLNRRATRQSARDCARTSVEAGHLRIPTDEQVDDLYSYLKSLRPEPSPYLAPDGGLTEAAERGRLLFEGKADCARCHPAPYFTDLKSHNVGVLNPTEPDGLYDTPVLIEAYRTAPYLHDGRARTLYEVLTIFNLEDQHGLTAGLTEQEIRDLEMYLLSM